MATEEECLGATVNIQGLQLQQRFHQRCGRRITLSNGNRTAARSVRDFSHALVFSAEPLIDDVLFEVIIEKKNHAWGGSIEIGVTCESPDKLELPSCATAMRNGSWVMSGIDVRKDGLCLIEFYGTDLETLNERDRVGVMRSSNAELVFFVNGESMGVAARNMPQTLWALVDLYGRCVQVSLYPVVVVTGHGGEDLPDTCLQEISQDIDVPMCVDVTVMAPSPVQPSNASSLDRLGDSGVSMLGCTNNNNNNFGALRLNDSLTSSSNCSLLNDSAGEVAPQSAEDFHDTDRLRFHTRCGSLVKLSPNYRCAERRRPLDEFNNGVVMTHRPLKDNELFEIRIDKLVDKWSGSIEVGVTTHNPAVLHFPATMTNMRSGTIMMSGCGILTNGKGTRRQYGEFNLDELREGDRVGMMRKANGNLHYYINGQDQGISATRVSPTLWGVIDLYGMTIKVTIVDRDEREQQNLVTRRNNIIASTATTSSYLSCGGISATGSGGGGGGGAGGGGGVTGGSQMPVFTLRPPSGQIGASCPAAAAAAAMAVASAASTAHSLLNHTEDVLLPPLASAGSSDRLTFHPLCGSHATVTHSGRTALRPNASDDFNNGVVLTRRPLRPNELFQVRLERIVTKWAGSVEMGVTTHCAESLDFPFTMTNVRSGTWMMTGNGVMHNGITVIERYGQNLDRLQVGDRVGVVRKDDGTLHFWVNGVDQGPAATNVPERVYGVIDLYGQAAQASIVDTSECGSPDTGNSTISNTTLYSDPPLRFHSIHGKNAGISNGGLTASRPNSLAEFNDAIVFSNRPLRQHEVFEVVLETMVRHWSGNIEIGVTGTRPEDVWLTANATDIGANDTIILCGSMIFHNRKTIRSNVLFDLDTMGAGTRVGVMRNGDYLHFLIDGVDQGPACECRMPNIWAVIDLYGQCAQVSLTLNQPDIRAPYATSENSQSCQATSVIQPGGATQEAKHRWTCLSGSGSLSQNWTVAGRTTGASAALSRCVVFSEQPLTVGSPFEIKITAHNPLYAGCLSIGITDLGVGDEYVRKNVPLSIRRIPANVWFITGNEVRYNSMLLQRSMVSLEWLRVGDRIALELTPARNLKILLNSEDMNIQFMNVPNNVYAVVELQGSTMAVQVISSQGVASPLRPCSPSSPLRPCSLRLQDSMDFGADALNKQDSMLESIDSEAQRYEFADFYGKHIRLIDDHQMAMRVQSYNHAMVYVTKPLCKGDSIVIRIDSVNPKWKGTLGLGVVGVLPQMHGASAGQPPPAPPMSIMHCKRPCWTLTHDYININGQKVASKLGQLLDQIQPGSIISLMLTHAGMLVIMIGVTHLDLAPGMPSHVYPVFDLYGKCEKISIMNNIDEEMELEYDDTLHEHDTNVPQCEKADLEVHEKETDPGHGQQQSQADTNGPQPDETPAGSNVLMNRSVMDSVSENLLLNISIKNRSLELNRSDSTASSSCCLRESLQLQHNTNLNIQRSQSTQRFQNAMNSSLNAAVASSASVAVAAPSTSTNSSTATTTVSAACSSTNSSNSMSLSGGTQRSNVAAAAGGGGVSTATTTATLSSTSTSTVSSSTPSGASGATAMQTSLVYDTNRGDYEMADAEPACVSTVATTAAASSKAANYETNDESNLALQMQQQQQQPLTVDCAEDDSDDDSDLPRGSGGLYYDVQVIREFDDFRSAGQIDEEEGDELQATGASSSSAAPPQRRRRPRPNGLAVPNELRPSGEEDLMTDDDEHSYLGSAHNDGPLTSSASASATTATSTATTTTTTSFINAPGIAAGAQQQHRADCEHVKLVKQFRQHLVLPPIFFQPSYDPICYCVQCNPQASEQLRGWVYYKLNEQTIYTPQSGVQTHQIDAENWLPLYYFTSVEKIRAILDHGEPLPLEDEEASDEESAAAAAAAVASDEPEEENQSVASNQKDEPGTRLELYTSPNAYSTHSMNVLHRFRSHRIGTAFEVYVRKQSLCATKTGAAPKGSAASPEDADAADGEAAGPLESSTSSVNGLEADALRTEATASSQSAANASFAASSAAERDDDGNATAPTAASWFTKEAGACVLTALLIKMEKITK